LRQPCKSIVLVAEFEGELPFDDPKLRESFLLKPMDALLSAMAEVDACYKERGNFQDKFGFGASPALRIFARAVE
jgi:hypothetical protein